MCRTEFVPEHGSEPLTCDREGIHIVHENYTTGVTFRRSRDGAEVRKPSK